MVSKIDREITNVNSVLGGCPEKGKIPIVFGNDMDAIIAGLNNAGVYRFKDARLIWIKNTLQLKYLKVSKSLISNVKANGKLRNIEVPIPLIFDKDGNLPFGTFPE